MSHLTESGYLQMAVGLPLSMCISELTTKRPLDPIEWMAQWLYRYIDGEMYFYEKKLMLKTMQKVKNGLERDNNRRAYNINQLSMGIRSIVWELNTNGSEMKKMMAHMKIKPTSLEYKKRLALMTGMRPPRVRKYRPSRTNRGTRDYDTVVKPSDSEEDSDDESRGSSSGDSMASYSNTTSGSRFSTIRNVDGTLVGSTIGPLADMHRRLSDVMRRTSFTDPNKDKKAKTKLEEIMGISNPTFRVMKMPRHGQTSASKRTTSKQKFYPKIVEAKTAEELVEVEMHGRGRKSKSHRSSNRENFEPDSASKQKQFDSRFTSEQEIPSRYKQQRKHRQMEQYASDQERFNYPKNKRHHKNSTLYEDGLDLERRAKHKSRHKNDNLYEDDLDQERRAKHKSRHKNDNLYGDDLDQERRAKHKSRHKNDNLYEDELDQEGHSKHKSRHKHRSPGENSPDQERSTKRKNRHKDPSPDESSTEQEHSSKRKNRHKNRSPDESSTDQEYSSKRKNRHKDRSPDDSSTDQEHSYKRKNRHKDRSADEKTTGKEHSSKRKIHRQEHSTDEHSTDAEHKSKSQQKRSFTDDWDYVSDQSSDHSIRDSPSTPPSFKPSSRRQSRTRRRKSMRRSRIIHVTESGREHEVDPDPSAPATSESMSSSAYTESLPPDSTSERNEDFLRQHGLNWVVTSTMDISLIRKDPALLKSVKRLGRMMGSAHWSVDCNLGLVCHHTILGVLMGRPTFVPPETPEWWEKQQYITEAMYDHEVYSCDNDDVHTLFNILEEHITNRDFIRKGSWLQEGYLQHMHPLQRAKYLMRTWRDVRDSELELEMVRARGHSQGHSRDESGSGPSKTPKRQSYYSKHPPKGQGSKHPKPGHK